MHQGCMLYAPLGRESLGAGVPSPLYAVRTLGAGVPWGGSPDEWLQVCEYTTPLQGKPPTILTLYSL